MPFTKIPAASFRSHISAFMPRAEGLTDKTAMYQDMPTLSLTTTELVLIKGTSSAHCNLGWVVAEKPDVGQFSLKGTSIALAWLS